MYACNKTTTVVSAFYRSSSTGGNTAPNINQAQPSNQTEEDIQLQLALQMSKEHQEEQDRLRCALYKSVTNC